MKKAANVSASGVACAHAGKPRDASGPSEGMSSHFRTRLEWVESRPLSARPRERGTHALYKKGGFPLARE